MIDENVQRQIIQDLSNNGILGVDECTPFPEPYCIDVKKVRAIYLGCDPSNKSGKRFKYAFALPTGEEYGFARFVKDHLLNLNEVGLSFDLVYAQNLCQNYFTEETSNNSTQWKKATQVWIPILKRELAVFRNDIPVLLTSAYLYHALVPGKKYAPMNFYSCVRAIPIPANDNLLNRPLVPFYRNRRKVDYHLSNPRWTTYKERIKEYLGGIAPVAQNVAHTPLNHDTTIGDNANAVLPDPNSYWEEQKKLRKEYLRTIPGILEELGDESFDLLQELKDVRGAFKLLEDRSTTIAELIVNDRAAFVHWERTEFIPYLRSERQKEILGAIEPLRIEGLEQWNGTQKELAVKARELYENKQYPSLRAACRAMCRQYTIEGRLIKTESLYTQAKESQGKPMV